MCELFGLASNLATTVNLSMRALAKRGNLADHLGDGWGIAFHAGDDVLLIKEPKPAGESAWVGFLETQHVSARIVLAHIRRATQGEVSLRNTQPFMRELGGRMHVFAHNGRLDGIERYFEQTSKQFRLVGSSDSEAAFCILMDRMAPLWNDAATPPSAAQRLAVVAGVAATMRDLGPANFLYADGDLLFAHGHRRTQPDGTVKPPGLTMLTRTCASDPDTGAASGVGLGDAQVLTLFASVPLTQEAWQPLLNGQIVVVANGQPLAM